MEDAQGFKGLGITSNERPTPKRLVPDAAGGGAAGPAGPCLDSRVFGGIRETPLL